MPFRNTDKTPPIYPAHSVVCIFDRVEDAEAALSDLDRAGLGDDAVYARGEEARKLQNAKNQGWLAHAYRAMQAVMSDELSVIRLYEKKIAEGASFILLPLPNASDVDRVADILKTHHVDMATYLGKTSFRSL